MTNIIWWVIALIFVAIISYIIGCRRGWKTYEHDFDDGWDAAASYYEQTFEIIPRLQKDREEHKRCAKLLLEELEELFKEDDEEIIDGGEY